MGKIDIEDYDHGARIIYIDNVTVAAIDLGPGVNGVGAAVCLPSDQYSREVGKHIALSRAIRNAGDSLEQTWLKRSVTKKEYKAKHRKGE
jgi:hypothetical protein